MGWARFEVQSGAYYYYYFNTTDLSVHGRRLDFTFTRYNNRALIFRAAAANATQDGGVSDGCCRIANRY